MSEENTQNELYRRLIREAVRETLLGIGVNMNDPSQLQADMHYLRKLRQGSEDMVCVLRRSAITLGLSTGLFLLWEAMKSVLHK